MLDRHTAEQLVLGMFAVVTHGDPELAIRCIHPDYMNEESANEPPACSTPGPAGLAATGAWLRSAYSDLHYEVRDILHDGDQAIAPGGDVRPPNRALRRLPPRRTTGRAPAHRLRLRRQTRPPRTRTGTTMARVRLVRRLRTDDLTPRHLSTLIHRSPGSAAGSGTRPGGSSRPARACRTSLMNTS